MTTAIDRMISKRNVINTHPMKLIWFRSDCFLIELLGSVGIGGLTSFFFSSSSFFSGLIGTESFFFLSSGKAISGKYALNFFSSFSTPRIFKAHEFHACSVGMKPMVILSYL